MVGFINGLEHSIGFSRWVENYQKEPMILLVAGQLFVTHFSIWKIHYIVYI